MRAPVAPEVEYQLVEVRKDLATRLLQHNTHNRPIRDAKVTQYSTDMSGGDWLDNGETVKFTGSGLGDPGVLLDGQHRLAAIARTDKPIRLLFAWNVHPDAQETIDTGAKRIFSDVLALREESNPMALAALTRAVAQYKMSESRIPTRSGSRAISNAQLLRTLREEPGLRQIAKDAAHVATKSALSPTIIGLCWWMFSKLEPDGAADAEDFFAKLINSDYVTPGDPIVELRKTAFNLRNLRGVHRAYTTMIAVTIKAWNAYRNNEPVGTLRWAGGGSNPEKFPEAY